MRTRWLLVALFLSTTAAHAEDLLVFAAASTTEAMQEAGKAFEAAHHQKVSFSFGASSALARQIQAGAPADLFLSADEAQMDALAKAGLIDSAHRKDIASNQLVVVVPKGSKLSVHGPEDLKQVKKLALADPQAVPAGVYARGWLERAGLWAELSPKVVPALDVRAALAAVASGAVDAGVVYRTDARTSKDVKIVLFVPRSAAPPIHYPLAKLTRSKNPAADAFFTFLSGPEGRQAFDHAGFLSGRH